MNVQDSFEVAAPADDVFAALLDLERVAPCLPGAEEVERVADGSYRGSIRVRVGPITMRYRADIEIVEQDPAMWRAMMRVQARETRGQGTADAHATLALAEEGSTTRGSIDVEVKLSGRAASMGQGAIQDVSSRLVGAFAKNLGAMLTAPTGALTSEPVAAEALPGPSGLPPSASASSPQPASPSPPAAPPISATDLAGAVLVGRVRRHRSALILLAAGLVIGLLVGRRQR